MQLNKKHLTICVFGVHALRCHPGASHDSCQVNIQRLLPICSLGAEEGTYEPQPMHEQLVGNQTNLVLCYDDTTYILLC